jgi:hypothetical protein
MENIQTKPFRITFLLLLFVVVIQINVSAQSMVVVMKNGVENSKQLKSIQNFSFTDSDLLLKLLNGTNENYSVANIRKIFFDETVINDDSTETNNDPDSTNNGNIDSDSTNIVDTDSTNDNDTDTIVDGGDDNTTNDTTGINSIEEPKMTIYPNPADNKIYIRNANNSTSKISIYRMDGAIVKRDQLLSDDNSIEINELPNGLYLLRINNQTLKFIKQ